MKRLSLSPKQILITLVSAVVVSAAFTGLAASPSRAELNSAAARAKARALVDLASTTADTDPLLSLVAAERARALCPGDTMVMLVSNDRRLMSNGRTADDYYNQLEIVRHKADVPISYYSPLLFLTRMFEADDSLATYRLARVASRRNPDMTGMTEFAVDCGIRYLHSLRFKGNDPDTLPLSDSSRAFGYELIGFADSVIARTGYNPVLDLSKARVFYLLGDTAAMRSLAEDMYIRDPENPDVLTNLTSLYMSLGDTAKITEMGLRNFEIQPNPDNVYDLYSTLRNPDDRKRMSDAVFKSAANPDIEPELRVHLLDALIAAYMASEFTDTAESDSLFARADEIATEMIAEEPSNDITVTSLAVLGRSVQWLHDYGYGYLADYVIAHPDSVDTCQSLDNVLDMFAAYAPDDARVDRVFDIYLASEDALPLEIDSRRSRYYVLNGRDADAIKILQPYTMERIRKFIEEEIAQMKEDGAELTEEQLDVDANTKEAWVNVQSIISECQERLGRTEDAIKTLQTIINIAPDNAIALNNLAYYMATNDGDLHQALILINRSLEIAPDSPNSLDTRAWISFLMGDTQAAYDDMVKLFESINFPMEIILETPVAEDEGDVPTEDGGFVEVIAERKLNPSALSPLLGHLLKILDKMGDQYAVGVKRILTTLKELDPDNQDLIDFIKEHPEEK